MSEGHLPPWEAANNGAGKRMWFVQRKGADRGDWPGASSLWYLEDEHGHLVRFGSYAAAYYRAERMNTEEADG